MASLDERTAVDAMALFTKKPVPERPILFSGAMVRAILAGTKTQTRRLVLGKDRKPTDYVHYWDQDGAKSPDMWRAADGLTLGWVRCPYGSAGTHLWVKETWHPDTELPIYASDYDSKEQAGVDRWKPSIFMPRSESRITLEVTGVRVERLNEISEDDVWAEGAITHVARHTFRKCYRDDDERAAKARELFRDLWNGINVKRAPWASNPWVWRVEFRRIEESRGAA